MKKIISAPTSLCGEILLPASKSISNRALIIGALSGSTMPIDNVSDCDDSRVVVEALSTMPRVIDIGAAGTAMRFLASMLATMQGEHVITGTERMQQRPIAPLVDVLRGIGADISYEKKEGFPPLRIRGRVLHGGRLSLPGNVSSQYISSLLMIGPTLKHGLVMELEGEVISRPYIDMTLAIMRQFGAMAEWLSDREIRVAPQPYTPVSYLVENDWSAASYWYEMVALAQDKNAQMRLPGLFAQSLQGDSAVAEIFSHLGVGTRHRDNAVYLYKTQARPHRFECSMLNQPDLAQTLVVTCCMLGIPFTLTGLQTLRIKETDRITALQRELGKLGYPLEAEGDDALSWDGTRVEELPNLDVEGINTYEDHRMAMAFAPVALKRGSITINNPKVVSKSYPGFWADLEKVGFKLG